MDSEPLVMNICYFSKPNWLPNINQVIAFLWDETYNVDTDGNATGPKCTTWTDLWCRSRSNEALEFEICLEDDVWRFAASDEELKNRLGLLATQMGSKVFVNKDLSNQILPETMCRNCGEFAMDQALERLANIPT